MRTRKSLREIGYVLVLLAVIIVLFGWYTSQNRKRMEERNKNYGADSARLLAVKIDDELNNAKNLINTYAYFVGESLTEPAVTTGFLPQNRHRC